MFNFARNDNDIYAATLEKRLRPQFTQTMKVKENKHVSPLYHKKRKCEQKIRFTPKIEGVELKNATVDLKKGVVVAEYGEEDIEKDISEIAVSLRSAIDYLLEDIHQYNFITTKKHMPKLYAFNQLIILAEAWNSFDEFKPDWENPEQDKWYPTFKSNDGKLEFLHAGYLRSTLDIHIKF